MSKFRFITVILVLGSLLVAGVSASSASASGIQIKDAAVGYSNGKIEFAIRTTSKNARVAYKFKGTFYGAGQQHFGTGSLRWYYGPFHRGSRPSPSHCYRIKVVAWTKHSRDQRSFKLCRKSFG